MELFLKILLFIIFVNFKENFVCDSMPIFLKRNIKTVNATDRTPAESERLRLSNFQAFAIVCAAWVAIAAIGWGFYFGFRNNNNTYETIENKNKMSFEKTSNGKCCANKHSENEFNIKNEDKLLEKTSCCGTLETKNKPNTARTVEQNGDKQSGCCKTRNSSSPNQSRSVTNKTEMKPYTGNDTGCCKKKTQSKSVTYDSKNMTYDSRQNPQPKPKKKCCPCGNKEKEECSVDITESRNTISQFSEKIIQESAPTVTKSQHPSLKYDFKHVKNASPANAVYTEPVVIKHVKQVQSIDKESEAKVMRAIPTYSTQLEREKATVTASQKLNNPAMPLRQENAEMMSSKKETTSFNQGIQGTQEIQETKAKYQPFQPNYILVQPMTRLNPCYEQKEESHKRSCCTFIPKETQGSIRPIISGYDVEGNLRLKGKNQKGLISIPDDSYIVLPR